MIRITRYEPALQPQWDGFVENSKNGTFLHRRAFMDHREQLPLTDYSLMVWSPKDELLAVLPANFGADETVFSHAGLTYGGLITNEQMTQPIMIDVFQAALSALRDAGHAKLVYKCVPAIYHRLPAEEDRHTLFLADATLVARDVLPVIAAHGRAPIQDRRRRGAKKAAANKIIVMPSEDLTAFWAIVEELLSRRQSRPVHTLSEITALKRLFPENIRLYAAFIGKVMVAGVLIFETPRVARAQYIAANDQGRNTHALDMVFTALLDEHYVTKPYFDFGGTTNNGGSSLNTGLSDQKEGFGARTVVLDRYEIDLARWDPSKLRNALS